MHANLVQYSNNLHNEKGFTLIELIMVIVILGMLAVVAIPKYQDMKTDAAEAQAEGVYGAAQSAAAINFSKRVIDPAAIDPIDTGARLMGALEENPEGWTSAGLTITKTIGAIPYTITITTTEDAGPTRKARLTKNW